MGKILKMFFVISVLLIPLLTSSCCCLSFIKGKIEESSVRVLYQDSNSAIIEAIGTSKTHAEIRAKKRASTIFKNYDIEEKEECTQEFSGSASYNANTGYGSLNETTYWKCVFIITKK
ncbi:MAG: hypothetical protein SVZ03_12060 [Spirochaetota bacterium]|nr:hypothetical protein [Spirochaetota bacterium]